MFRNDPDLGAIPAVGKGSVDIGKRTLVGEAVIYDGTDPDALIVFLGDSAIKNVAGELYRAAGDGVLTPMVKLKLPAIIVRPPAGDWFTVTEDQLKQEYAIHVNVPFDIAPGKTFSIASGIKPSADAKPTINGDAKPAAKKAPAKKVAAAKK